MAVMRDDRMPRVVMIVRLFHPWVGGTERQAHKLAKELIDQGLSVRVVTGRWFRGTPRAETIDGVPVTRHNTLYEFYGIRGLRKLGGYLYALSLAWHLVRTRTSYDIVHVHGLNYHTGVAAIVSRRLRKGSIVKLANSGAASDIERTRRGRQLAGSRFLLPAALGCDRLVALTPVIADELRAAAVDEFRIVLIPNGVDVSSNPSLTSRSSRDSTLRVVSVGRLHHQKGADILVHAAKVLAERHAHAMTVRIVGDGPERAALEDLIQRLNLSDVVTLVGEVDDPNAELDAADVFVLPSRTEGMSNALLEAMARRKAIIATAVPGSAQVLTHGRTGLLVPPEDPTALADALSVVAEDPAACDRMAEAAGVVVREKYAMPIVAARYAAVYAELLAPTRLDEAQRPSERWPGSAESSASWGRRCAEKGRER